jgi:hypothetical protein
MDVAWGDALDDGSAGQDILGIRGLDQSLEAALVNGLTTVSQRGRYLTILPWAVGEYFAAERDAGRGEYDKAQFQRFLFRVEFLTLAASVLVEKDGDAVAALGARNFGVQMAAIKAGEPTPIPTDRIGGMLNTYFGPCQQLGIIRFGEGAEPYRLTPRGQAIWRARNAASDQVAVRALLGAEVLTRADVEAVADHFALQRLKGAAGEAALLREALTEPWPPEIAETRIKAAYERFGETIRWLRDGAAAGPLQADRLLADAWRRAALGEPLAGEVRLSWAEYEWRRRLHYALELMLAAVANTVMSRGAATPEELVEDWLSADLPDALILAWPEAKLAAGRSGARAITSVPEDLWLVQAPSDALANLSDHARAYSALALAAAVARQSAGLRADGRFRNHHAWGERALAVIEEAGEEPFGDTLRALAAIAVQAHLSTTFRKMAGGMNCSLRLFAEGPMLRSTGRPTGAGRSGPRLWNVIRVLQDAGVDGLEAEA